MQSHSRFPSQLDIAAVFCLAVLPDLLQSMFVVTGVVRASGYTFAYMHNSLIVRSLQASVPIILIMHLRNVRWSDHGFTRCHVRDVAVALGLVVISYGAYAVVYNILVQFGCDHNAGTEVISEMLHFMSPTAAVAIPVIFVSSAANGFAEELALRSYLIPRIVEVSGSRVAAVLVTSVLVATHHLYQGPLGAAAAFSTGIVFGAYFVEKRRFWPVAIAHALMDVVPQLIQR